MPDNGHRREVHLELARRRADLADSIARLQHLFREKLEGRKRMAASYVAVALFGVTALLVLRTFLRRA